MRIRNETTKFTNIASRVEGASNYGIGCKCQGLLMNRSKYEHPRRKTRNRLGGGEQGRGSVRKEGIEKNEKKWRVGERESCLGRGESREGCRVMRLERCEEGGRQGDTVWSKDVAMGTVMGNEEEV